MSISIKRAALPLHLLARLTTVAPDGLLTAVNHKDGAFKSLTSVDGCFIFFSNLFIHFSSFQTVYVLPQPTLLTSDHLYANAAV